MFHLRFIITKANKKPTGVDEVMMKIIITIQKLSNRQLKKKRKSLIFNICFFNGMINLTVYVITLGMRANINAI